MNDEALRQGRNASHTALVFAPIPFGPLVSATWMNIGLSLPLSVPPGKAALAHRISPARVNTYSKEEKTWSSEKVC